MKAYKVEIIVVDHENLGGDVLIQNIKNMRYYNPSILTIKEADIGEWRDDHPFNLRSTSLEDKLKYFIN